MIISEYHKKIKMSEPMSYYNIGVDILILSWYSDIIMIYQNIKPLDILIYQAPQNILSLDHKAFIPNSSLCALMLRPTDRLLVVQIGDIVTLKTLKTISFPSSIIEHISCTLARSSKVYFDQTWSERNENPPWQSMHRAWHNRTLFCKHALPLCLTPFLPDM